ncbi:hypothetical protein A2U01_0099705 [Trifolium medium]|uniref:Uncharacterized protein n=1 Tax=Trifolium medium TaxID=97028 RepID=A0A392UUM5_9FABA|nr:hypothetical protein [Trifolium medium]
MAMNDDSRDVVVWPAMVISSVMAMNGDFGDGDDDFSDGDDDDDLCDGDE